MYQITDLIPVTPSQYLIISLLEQDTGKTHTEKIAIDGKIVREEAGYVFIPSEDSYKIVDTWLEISKRLNSTAINWTHDDLYTHFGPHIGNIIRDFVGQYVTSNNLQQWRVITALEIIVVGEYLISRSNLI